MPDTSRPGPPWLAPPTLREPASDAAIVRQRILFVDDEPQILEGLQNALRKQRQLWDMTFAAGADAALVELERTSFDVVVSDMRMPGIDGAALLKAVKDRYPGVTRIVLSGHAEEDAIVRALPVAHQFLSKPCDGNLLRMVVERACTLQRLLRNDAIRRAAGRLDQLPSAADIYWELTKRLNDPNATLDAVAAVVERDPAMSAKVLQLVNSAFFGLPRRVTRLSDAVRYLGTDTLRSLALTVKVFSIAGVSPTAAPFVDRLRSHALASARLASQFLSDRRQSEDAFTGALLHDIGQLVLAVALSDDYDEVLREFDCGARPLQEIEYERLGVSHAEVGAYLLGVWGLPFTVVEAVACHHRPSLVAEGDRGVLAAVHAADALVDGDESALDMDFLEAGGWVHDLPRWRTLAGTLPADSPAAEGPK